METGADLAQQAARAIAASSTTSRIAAGRNDATRDPALVDAINQVFALFRLNFHNQYYKAYEDAGQLGQIKKLWLDSLASQPVEVILLAAKRCIETCQFLPTLHQMLSACREVRLSDAGLPDVHAAYLEACLAPEPKQAQRWSHPAVYLAGCAAGWFMLASATEAKAFPVFERHYRACCDRIAEGEQLALPPPADTTVTTGTVPDLEQQRESLRRLREETGI